LVQHIPRGNFCFEAPLGRKPCFAPRIGSAGAKAYAINLELDDSSRFKIKIVKEKEG